ncbi:hypothetical protein FO488_03230 [Geobacter sp. FeAm09]|uniref:hypothetical protein n=1 Tax=Geobacter sp. FeAm09 TaxID=2597769 RepID=UPI0011ECD079|nr:hypothetical protein [Geobacter sp. FeAm09]QEM67263.1 hypothetical protein FO488_03230 [Geobacter sp. FeAm09]
MMRMIIAALMLLALATPSLAARVYLKDGGRIDAQSVWRSPGKVHVLVNRDTLTEYAPSEIDMKRTFPKRHHRAVRRQPHAAIPHKGTAAAPTPAAPVQAAAAQKPAGRGLSLPKLPSKLPEMSPPSLGGREEGTIRKQKKEMQERLNDSN